MGVSETRWPGEGDFYSEEFRVIHSGKEGGQGGVGVILDKRMAISVKEICFEGERLMMVKLSGKPVDVVVIQVYMATSDYKEEEIEEMYERRGEIMDRETKGRDYTVLMGDFNAVVGEGREDKITGKFGLGKRNGRGELLVEFCKRRQLCINNTWFDQEKRRRYTWTRPGNTGRFQIDYIITKQRYWNSVINSKTYPGADVDSDHNPVVSVIKIKLKVVHKARVNKRWNTECLKDKNVAMEFMKQTEEKLDCKKTEERDKSCNDRWRAVKRVVTEAAESTIGVVNKQRIRKPWITTEMLDRMEERRMWKNVDTTEGRSNYKSLNNSLRRETDRARENWWREQCAGLEQLDKDGRSDLLYRKVREITKRPNRKILAGIRDKEGNNVNDPEKVGERWKEYIEELYDKEGKPTEEESNLEEENDTEEGGGGAELLYIEFERALEDLKNGKAVGTDNIPADRVTQSLG